MKTSNREILIFYNAGSGKDRKTIAQVRSIVPYAKIHSFETVLNQGIAKDSLIRILHLHADELLSRVFLPGHELDPARDSGGEEEEWMSALSSNPGLFEAPIAVRGDSAVICSSPTDIYKLSKEEKYTIY
jgi:arsenate reductase